MSMRNSQANSFFHKHISPNSSKSDLIDKSNFGASKKLFEQKSMQNMKEQAGNGTIDLQSLKVNIVKFYKLT